MKSCEKHNQKAGFDLHGMITITACRMLKKFGIQTNFWQNSSDRQMNKIMKGLQQSLDHIGVAVLSFWVQKFHIISIQKGFCNALGIS